jgi:hypothetical protein
VTIIGNLLKFPQDGKIAAHSAVLWKLLTELELNLMAAEGETQILLLPGFTVPEVRTNKNIIVSPLSCRSSLLIILEMHRISGRPFLICGVRPNARFDVWIVWPDTGY